VISLGPLLLGLSLQALIVSLGTGMPWFAAGGVVLSVAATLYMLIRFLFISFIGRKERQSKAFLQRIERLIAAATTETTSEHAAQSPLLSPSALDDAAVEAPASPRNRQHS
jgi:hypothetical protein